MNVPNDAPSFFERPETIRRIQWALLTICTMLVLAEFGYEHHHPHFELETVFGFQAWLGFGAFVAAVAAGATLRLLIARPEDYYRYDDVPRMEPDPMELSDDDGSGASASGDVHQ